MKTMKDSNGVEIPVKYISAYDKKRDAIVRRILSRWVKAQAVIEKTVRESLADAAELMDKKDVLGVKGNFSAQSFDGSTRIVLSQRYSIRMDERVVTARELMLAYIEDLFQKSLERNVDLTGLKMLVLEAFKAGQNGFLSAAKIIALLRIEINDERWHKAKELLQASMTSEKSKRYFSVETRKGASDWKQIRLDAAAFIE